MRRIREPDLTHRRSIDRQHPWRDRPFDVNRSVIAEWASHSFAAAAKITAPLAHARGTVLVRCGIARPAASRAFTAAAAEDAEVHVASAVAQGAGGLSVRRGGRFLAERFKRG